MSNKYLAVFCIALLTLCSTPATSQGQAYGTRIATNVYVYEYISSRGDLCVIVGRGESATGVSCVAKP